MSPDHGCASRVAVSRVSPKRGLAATAALGRASYPCSRPVGLDVALYLMEDHCHSRSQGCCDYRRGEGGRDFGSAILALADVFRASATPEERERSLTAWRDLLRALMLELIAGQGPRAWIVAVTGLFTMSLPRPTAPIEWTFTMIAGARKPGATIYATIRAKLASPTPRITPTGGARGERVKRAIQGDLGATSRLEGLPIPQI